jgi:hypothetical protein
MSIAVSLDGLRDAVAGFDRAPYLLTVSDDGRPHAVAVPVSWRDDDLVAVVGRRSATNAATRPLVSLVFAAPDASGFSLIVDTTVAFPPLPADGGSELVLRPTSAVLHRPARADDGSLAPGSDCAAVLSPSPDTRT